MSDTMKKWWEVRLARMDEKARCLCGTDVLRELGEGLRLIEIYGTERDSILAELDRMLEKNSDNYQQCSIEYLVLFRRQLNLRPWYTIVLDKMARYLMTSGAMLPLREAGEDLLSTAIAAHERLLIVARIDDIIASDPNSTENTAFAYIRELRRQIAGR